MDIRAAVDLAIEELQTKSASQIEKETAEKWLARSIAAYQFYVGARAMMDANSAMEWIVRAEEYRHEAIEHAALAEDGGAMLATVERETKAWRAQAEQGM